MKLPEHVTAEDVKQVLDAYQREHFPGGRWASAMFDTGTDQPETLVTTRPAPGVSDPPSPAPLEARARSS